MIEMGCLKLSRPPTVIVFCHYRPTICKLTKQGHRFLTSLATSEEPSSSIGLLRKFVSSSSKHVVLTTLSHLLSPATSNPRLSFHAFPLYTIIRNQAWFSWNARLEADLIASLFKQQRFDEAECLFTETVSKLFKERDLCLFYRNLIDSHAKHMSKDGVTHSCRRLKHLIQSSSSVYVKQKGYESMISGFCEIGAPDEARKLIEEMKGMELKPSIFEFRCIAYSYGQMGFLEDMKRTVVEMEKEGIELDTVCCNIILSSFGAHGKLLDMLLWLEKMRSSDIPFSLRTYNSVLNSCPNITLLLQDLNFLPLKIDELLNKLSQDESNLVRALLRSSIIDQVMESKPSELKLDLHGMHLTTAYLVLLQWLEELRVKFASGNQPTPLEILVVCGWGKHSSTRGESHVKGLVKAMVTRMKCPLRIDRKNIGCFVTKGKVFRDWLLQKYQ